MSEIILGKNLHPGNNRESNEDRVHVEHVVNAGGLTLDVAIIADGVGGFERGEQAAQITIDSVLDVLKNSSEKEPAKLLNLAVQTANTAVYNYRASIGENVSSTLSVAIIRNGHDINQSRLYIANVGDSRIYLCRRTTAENEEAESDETINEKYRLTQLTLDHSFKNTMVIDGVMTLQSAAVHPSADILTRAIGINPTVVVDLGLHTLGTTSQEEYLAAQKRGIKGIPLKEGDSVMVCSDGLIKNSPINRQPLVQKTEIIEVLASIEADKAALTLVSYAVGRQADDNISVALLQTPDPARKELAASIKKEAVTQNQKERSRLRWTFSLLGLVGVLVIVAVILFGMNRVDSLAGEATAEALLAQQTAEAAEAAAGEAIAAATSSFVETQTAVALSQAEATAVAATATEAYRTLVDSFTPTPTPTATPSPTPFIPPESNQVAVAFVGNEREVLSNRSKVEKTDQFILLQFNPKKEESEVTAFNDGNLFLSPGSGLRVIENASAIEAVIERGSVVFLSTNDFESGAEITLNDHSDIVFLAVNNSCMSIEYRNEADTANIGCFKGNCGYFFGDERVNVGEGDYFQVPLNGSEVIQSGISAGLANRFNNTLRSNFQRDDNGRREANQCDLSDYIPTPTPTPTAQAEITAPAEETDSDVNITESDQDGDGIENSNDLCPVEAGFQHNCGCPEDKKPRSCGDPSGGGNDDNDDDDGGR